jgi:hypothetical protein
MSVNYALLKRRLQNLPQHVRAIAQMQGVWIIGSTAEWLISRSAELPKDYDFIVAPESLQAALRILGAYSYTITVNSFGGIKASKDRVIIDIWPCRLDEFIVNGTGKIAVGALNGLVVRW